MDFIIYAKRIGRHLEGKYDRGFKKWKFLSYTTVEEFLSDLKEEFGGGNDEIIKVTELKKAE